MGAEGSIAVVRLTEDRFDDVVETLCSAFRDYPVMRLVIGDAGDDYERRLRLLTGWFQAHRFGRGYPILGAVRHGRILGAASLSPPVAIPLTPALERLQEELWTQLGPAAAERMKAFAAATDAFEPAEPHYHLGLLGVHRDFAGKGVGRKLADAVHELSRNDPDSTGVSLTTEDPLNVALYRHLGYTVVGEADVDSMHTWGFFRPDAPPKGSD